MDNEAPRTVMVENKDWFLQLLVGLCNESTVLLPITLVVHGAYIAGYVVPPKYYMEGVKSELAQGSFNPPQIRDLLGEVFDDARKAVTLPPLSDVDEEKQSLRYQPTYIHLKAARFFAPNELNRPFPTPPKGAWWRGKINSVDGFFIGMPFPE